MKVVKNIETPEGLRPYTRFIEKRFLAQPRSKALDLRVPSSILKGLEKQHRVKTTKWAVKQVLRGLDFEREREIVAPARLEGDIETVYLAACVTWHCAWDLMTYDRSLGLTRGVDARKKLRAGDFVKIEAPLANADGSTSMMSWILRVNGIEGDIASVEVLAKRGIQEGCFFIRDTLHLDCLYKYKDKFGLKAERIRRPDEGKDAA